MMRSISQRTAVAAAISTVLCSTAVSAAETAASAAPGALVTVWLANHQVLKGRVDERTDGQQLWLRFGSGSTVVSRSIAWGRVIAMEYQGRSIGAAQMTGQRLSASGRSGDPQLPATSSDLKATDPASQAVAARRLLGLRQRVASVHFDAHLANWDRDVLTDGLVVRLTALDEQGVPVLVRGVLEVKVVSSLRVAFHQAPRSRGKLFRQLGRWRVRVDPQSFTGTEASFRLPFQASHPELDTDWSAHGLVQIRLVIPGQGVFERSLSAVRIRPFAPLRDTLERQGERRFLPAER